MSEGPAKVRIDCPFCGHTIVGDFFEDVDAHIMACRDLHPEKGRLTEEACRTRPEPEITPDASPPTEGRPG